MIKIDRSTKINEVKGGLTVKAMKGHYILSFSAEVKALFPKVNALYTSIYPLNPADKSKGYAFMISTSETFDGGKRTPTASMNCGTRVYEKEESGKWGLKVVPHNFDEPPESADSKQFMQDELKKQGIKTHKHILLVMV